MRLDMMRGSISILSILMRISPGKETIVIVGPSVTLIYRRSIPNTTPITTPKGMVIIIVCLFFFGHITMFFRELFYSFHSKVKYLPLLIINCNHAVKCILALNMCDICHNKCLHFAEAQDIKHEISHWKMITKIYY